MDWCNMLHWTFHESQENVTRSGRQGEKIAVQVPHGSSHGTIFYAFLAPLPTRNVLPSSLSLCKNSWFSQCCSLVTALGDSRNKNRVSKRRVTTRHNRKEENFTKDWPLMKAQRKTFMKVLIKAHHRIMFCWHWWCSFMVFNRNL